GGSAAGGGWPPGGVGVDGGAPWEKAPKPPDGGAVAAAGCPAGGVPAGGGAAANGGAAGRARVGGGAAGRAVGGTAAAAGSRFGAAAGCPAGGVAAGGAGRGPEGADPGRATDGGVQERTTVSWTASGLGYTCPTSRLSSCWAVGRLSGNLSSALSTSSRSAGSSPDRSGCPEMIWCSTAGTVGALKGARPVPA